MNTLSKQEIEFDEIEEEEDFYYNRFVIRTSNLAFQIWKVIIIIISFISSFDYVRMAAFDEEAEYDYYADLVYQLIFSIDLVINFFTEHHYSNTKMSELNLKKIMINYLQGRFFLDLLALFPLVKTAE